MKVAVPILRSLGMAAALLSLGHGSAHGQADAGPAVTGETTVAKTSPPTKDSKPEKTDLPPEAQKLLQDLFDKAKTQKATLWNAEMKKQIDDIAKATSLNDAGRQNLATAANQAVAASAEQWGNKSMEFARKQFAMMPRDQLLAMLHQAERQPAMMAQGEDMPIAGQFVEPKDQEAWTKALKQVLTAAQLDAWTQAQAKQKAEVEKQVSSIIKNGEVRIRDQETHQITSECKSLESTLNLPKDRSAQIEAFGKSAVDQTIEAWRKDEEKMLLAMNPNQLRQLTNNGWYMGVNPAEEPTKQAVWKDGLAHLLTADEKTRLQADQDARHARRQHIMGLVMVMLLDEKLALTQAQRQKLEPIANRLIKDNPQLYPEGTGSLYLSLSTNIFYNTTSNASPAELKPILDAIQLKRWQDLPKADFSPDNTDDNAATPQGMEPEDVERIISSYFYEKAEDERKRTLEENMLKAEDIIRVAGLNPEEAERLQAAACGVTEQNLVSWRWFIEQQIRSQLQDVTPQNVRQRLDGLQNFFFQRSSGSSNQQTIWDETVQTELTPRQQDAWKKETAARDDYRVNAIAQVVLSDFDRQVHLSDEQWTKLLPLITGVLKDYGPSFTQFFSSMANTPWYLAGYYTLIPMAGIEDQDLKSIITKDQMDEWTGSQQFANSTNLWQTVKQMQPRFVVRQGIPQRQQTH